MERSGDKPGIRGKIVLDGSFISSRSEPGDFDAILVYDDEVEHVLAQNSEAMRLIDYRVCKQAGFDLFAFSAGAIRDFPDWSRTDAFDYDKITGQAKGVLEVAL